MDDAAPSREPAKSSSYKDTSLDNAAPLEKAAVSVAPTDTGMDDTTTNERETTFAEKTFHGGSKEVVQSSPGFRYNSVYTLQGHKRSISSLVISPDGLELASSGSDGLVKVWSLATGALKKTLDYTEAATSSEPIHNHAPLELLGLSDVAWSRDGLYLICGGDDRVVRIWDAKKYLLVRELYGHTSYVFCVTFSPDGTLAVSGSFDETVRIWDIQKGSCHRSIAAHSEAVTGVAYNRDGSILASCSYDGLIRLWDTSTGQCLKTLVHGEAPPIGHVTFSPNAFQLLATSLDGTIRLWDMANGRVLKTYVGHQNSRFALKAAFTAWNVPTTSAHRPPCSVVAGSEDQRVYVWDLQNKAVIQTLLGHRDTVLCIATHERLPIIASASLDRDPCIKVWQAVETN